MNQLTLAVAGGRKTQSIVEECCALDAGHQVLVVTFTQANQQELRDRLARLGPTHCGVDVQGWFAFLMAHWVRPYLPRRFAGRRLRGMDFYGDPGYVAGERRFLNGDGQAYRVHLAQLAFDTNQAASGAAIDRLAHLYDTVYIDEVQDLNGWDLEILSELMASRISLKMVGDVRQAILSTNVHDPKNSPYRGIKIMNWFAEQEKAGHLTVTRRTETWRCSQTIAALADSIIDKALGFPATESKAQIVSSHQGIFSVAVADAEAYFERFKPLCLRERKDVGNACSLPYVNIGDAKGLESEHVLLWSSGPVVDFLKSGKPLKEQSACKLYVGTTRARASVAFITDKDVGLTHWQPSSEPAN